MSSTTNSDTKSMSGRKRKLAKTQQEEERTLAQSLDNVFASEHGINLQYITDQLSGPQGFLVDTVVALLRQGVLEKAYNAAAQRDSVLDDDCIRYRNLKGSHIVQMILVWEPSLQRPEDDLKNVCRSTLLKWVLFALGVKESFMLPTPYPSLREVSGLAQYTKLRYEDLGCRPKPLVAQGVQEINADLIHGYFTMDMQNSKVVCHVLSDAQGHAKSFDFDYEGESDWKILKGMSLDAVLVSEATGDTVRLAGRVKKSLGDTLPPETMEWAIAEARIPAAVSSPPAGGEVVDGFSGSSAAPRAQGASGAPPSGSGRAAKAKAKAKAQAKAVA